MITERQFEDGIAEFKQLVCDGFGGEAAVEAAADFVGLEVRVLANRLTISKPIAVWVKDIQREVARKRFEIEMRSEVNDCQNRAGSYARISLFNLDARQGAIIQRLEERLYRKLSDHEKWKVGEALSPLATAVRLKDRDAVRSFIKRMP